MPTGYTAKIKDGTTFEEFVWTCARAFGALIDMRDAGPDAVVPEEFKPSPYYRERLAELEDVREKLDSLELSEAAKLAKMEHDAVVRQNADREQSCDDLKWRYEAMIARVKDWMPPSPDHKGMKEFMLDQLRQSIKQDCNAYVAELPSLDGTVWLGTEKRNVQVRLAYAHKNYAEELERTSKRNQWISQLRASVPQPGKVAA